MRFMKFNATAFISLTLCGIYLASLGLQSLSLQAHAEEVRHFQDGWTLLNPPPILNQTQTFKDLWTLDVKTQPLFDDLSPETHPLASDLNHYYDVRFTPDPTLFEFTGDVTQYYKKHTPHFVKDNLTAQYQQYLAQLEEETNAGQHFKNGLKTFTTTLKTIPLILLCTVLCFPMVPSIIDSEITQPARSRKETLNRKKKEFYFSENQLYLSQMGEALLPRLQRLDDLQQDYTDPSKNKALLSYHVLPTTRNYDLDLKKKRFRYGRLPEVLSFGLKLKKEMPLKAFEGLLAKEFKLNPNNSFSASTTSWRDTSNLFLDEQKYVTDCTLGLNGDFKSFRLSCNGYTFHYKPAKPLD
ncbi:MAG: hypothetical protein HEQ32_05365 [Vampirovibrio sp.]